jgi:hypothetical protein
VAGTGGHFSGVKELLHIKKQNAAKNGHQLTDLFRHAGHSIFSFSCLFDWIVKCFYDRAVEVDVA